MNNDRWEFYSDNAGEWRWRHFAGNGKIIGASTEGFSSKQACINNAKLNGYEG